MRGTWLYCFAIAATLILAATLRITSTDTSRAIVLGDETTYWYAGQSIANYGVLTREVDGAMFRGEVPLEPTLRLSPGYPVFIAALGSVAPGSTEAVLASNIVLSIASLVLMLLVMHRLNLKRWAICTVLALAAVYPGFIYNLDRMLTEQLFVALLLSFVWVALIGIQSGKLWPLMVAGMLLALTTHVRAQALPFLLVAVVFILIMQPREKWLRQIIALVGTFAVFMAPWWVRNFATFGRFVLLTDADQGAAIWGAVPYFIDMGSSHGTLAEVVARNMPPNEAVYYRWRVFGFLQFMWGGRVGRTPSASFALAAPVPTVATARRGSRTVGDPANSTQGENRLAIRCEHPACYHGLQRAVPWPAAICFSRNSIRPDSNRHAPVTRRKGSNQEPWPGHGSVRVSRSVHSSCRARRIQRLRVPGPHGARNVRVPS